MENQKDKKIYMSYENYDKTSSFYDKTRKAVGVEIIINCLE